jgi:hypothetical protein
MNRIPFVACLFLVWPFLSLTNLQHNIAGRLINHRPRDFTAGREHTFYSGGEITLPEGGRCAGHLADLTSVDADASRLVGTPAQFQALSNKAA